MFLRSLLFIISIAISVSSYGDLFKKNQPHYLPSEEAFAFSAVQEGEAIQLRWQIAPDYYLYKDKIQVEAVKGKVGILDLPVAQKYVDPFFGEVGVYKDLLTIRVPVVSSTVDFDLNVEYQGCTEGFCYPPQTQTVHFSQKLAVTFDQKFANFDSNRTAYDYKNKLSDNPISLFWFLILGIGLAFTPCVMPMLPLLSSIVLGQQQRPSGKRALLLSVSYVQGMALTYSLLGLVVVSIGLPFQVALQSPVVLISLSVVFGLFALSMFGLFEITLPNKWQQKLNQISQNQQGGSLQGAFVMGMVAGLIASPCTSAPLSGALLYVSQTGNFWVGGFALYLLGLGMGIPLILVSLFGHQILPKSGDWLVKVKIAFGFIMLALPIFLLSRIIPHYVEPLLWSSLAMAFLIWLHFQLPRQQVWYKIVHIGLFMLIIVSAKPFFDFIWNSHSAPPSKVTSTSNIIKVTSFADLQQKVTAYKGKKMMLDLYADWCVSCEMLEKDTFSDPKVKQKLDQFIVLKADLTKNTAKNKILMKKLKILGLPSVLFFNEQGQEQIQKRVTGFIDAKDFLKRLDSL
ncbi:protein-disulfide reductase DsbD [Phocoenobacter skyensis]|uniref:Thiol:disulfide interchange protein DsbD n=1 Tax=Phocoenobacter skyensis TaxID=97481 RepID=A0A1H8AAB2_9PAST|nr:protein-disulfide reductase DsbD [Pasteurella skyensis]MDP8080389.1 protein-disulfide reductase DsbD [Pasteurella skyensis]MDP8086379.1 protein-disulfide reductase DsbD [Pasteurella skyensis]MDP8186136.1 protein-disulfide reductase DsbD [Pasteurella skyensis]QLB22977.1 protein-disulfide reductase DsbD [Pasteurella skyensis]SEM66507.1 thiol:disulfide interchange protein DsbD [Pasteurella skyensis]